MIKFWAPKKRSTIQNFTQAKLTQNKLNQTKQTNLPNEYETDLINRTQRGTYILADQSILKQKWVTERQTLPNKLQMETKQDNYTVVQIL